MLLAIPILLKVRDYLYKQKGYTVHYLENTIFNGLFFTGTFIVGLIIKDRLIVLLSLPFLVWLIIPLVMFSLRQWKEFLDLLSIYLRR